MWWIQRRHDSFYFITFKQLELKDEIMSCQIAGATNNKFWWKKKNLTLARGLQQFFIARNCQLAIHLPALPDCGRKEDMWFFFSDSKRKIRIKSVRIQFHMAQSSSSLLLYMMPFSSGITITPRYFDCNWIFITLDQSWKRMSGCWLAVIWGCCRELHLEI